MKRVGMIRGALLLLALLPVLAQAQRQWLDAGFASVPQDEATFYAEAPREEAGGWPVKVFFLDGSLHLEGTLNGPDLENDGLVGPYRFFHNNGAVAEEGSRDEASRYHGELRAYHGNGQLRFSMHYRHGEVHGTLTEYHANGQLQGITELADGRRVDGELLRYDAQGRLAERLFYLDGELDGVAERYRDGVLLSREPYRKGLEDGVRQNFHADGSLASEATYKEGKLEGPERRWSEAGVLIHEANYRNDKREGAFRLFAEEGHLLEESEYRAGVEVGLSRRYHLSGALREEERRNDKGQRQQLVSYDAEGRKQSVEVSENGPQGPQVRKEQYRADGSLEHREQYARDDRYRWSLSEMFAEDGSLIGRNEQRNGQAQGLHLSVNYDGGRQQQHYRNGRREGEFLQLSGGGEVLGKGRYRADKPVGEWLEVNGEQRFLSRYDEQGRLHGEQRREARDGALLQVDRYRNGALHGRHERYEEGRLVDAGNYRDDLRDGDWQVRLYDGRVWRGRYRQGTQVGLWEARSVQGYLLESAHYDNEGRAQGSHYGFADDGGLLKIERYVGGNLQGLSEYFVDGRRYMVMEYAGGQLLDTRHDEPDTLLGN